MGIVSRTEIDGKTVLALSSGLSEYAAAKSRLQRGSLSTGYLISPDGAVTPWITEGSFCRDLSADPRVSHEGIFHLYGPDFDGTALVDIVRDPDPVKAWKRFQSVIRTIQEAAKTAGAPGQAVLAEAGQTGPAGILLAADGSILVLGEVYRRCLAGQGETTEREHRLEWVHPDCAREPAEKNFAFLSAALAYRIAGGVSPFMTGQLWSLREKACEQEAAFIARLVRGGYVLPLSTVNQAAAGPFSDTVMKTLAGEHPDGISAILGFKDLPASIAAASSPQADTAETSNETAVRLMKARLTRTIFIRKHSTKFILTGLVTGFLAVFISMYVSDLRNKPDTAGMESREVVIGFYDAVARLDANTITSFATNSASKEYTNLVSGMYMTNRILGRDEITGRFTNPQRLFRDALNASHTVYGITRLEVQDAGSDGERAEFLVSLYLFLPEETREENGFDMAGRAVQPLTVYRYRDRCVLTRKKNRWKITGIEQLERSIEEASGRVIFNAIASGTGNTLPYAPR